MFSNNIYKNYTDLGGKKKTIVDTFKYLFI